MSRNSGLGVIRGTAPHKLLIVSPQTQRQKCYEIRWESWSYITQTNAIPREVYRYHNDICYITEVMPLKWEGYHRVLVTLRKYVHLREHGTTELEGYYRDKCHWDYMGIREFVLRRHMPFRWDVYHKVMVTLRSPMPLRCYDYHRLMFISWRQMLLR